MKWLIFFIAAFVVVSAIFKDPLRNLENIQDNAPAWFDKASSTRYTKIVHHATYETEKGAKVCYRAINELYIDVICLGWDKGGIVNLEDYRITNLDF